jgi:hypothetical protein
VKRLLWIGVGILLLPLAGMVAGQGDPVDVVYGYTYQQADGNRYVLGVGAVPDAAPVDIPLAGQPVWVVAAPYNGLDVDTVVWRSIWAVVLDTGQTQAFRIAADGTVEAIALAPAVLPVGMPPLLRVADGVPSLVVAPANDASLLTHPLVLADDSLLYVTTTGEVVRVAPGGRVMDRFGAGALLDTRLLYDGERGVRFYSDPTDRYDHGVLGDGLEAQSVGLLEVDDLGGTSGAIGVGSVLEGITPIWVDLNGDAVRDVVVTVSDRQQGAQVQVIDGTGQGVWRGPAIGQGYRWRHTIAVAPVGPNGETELIDVLTPHLGGVVEFYRLAGTQLEIVAQVSGFTSHVIGSRNLDMAAVGDFDGDGQLEVLLPDQRRESLGGIRRTVDGAVVAWQVPLGGRLVTNLAAVTLPDGGLAVGAGHDGAALRVWLPLEPLP